MDYMNRIKYCTAAFACILLPAFYSCTEKPAGSTDDDCKVNVSIAVPLPAATKVTGTDGEDTVNSLQVFVFRPDGVLEAYRNTAGNNAEVECTVGPKDIAAVVNAPEITGVRTKAELEGRISSLADSSPGSFVMSGIVTCEISSASGTVEVSVSRLVARISIQKITNKMELEQYRGSEFRIKRVYLVNAAGDRKYFGGHSPSVWYNSGHCEGQGELPELLNSGEIEAEVLYGTSYEQAHYLYCYPNPSETGAESSPELPGYTRLVVEIAIDGKLYYYPVSVENVKSNFTYNISELVVTRLGSGDPDIPVSVHEASFSVEVAPWEKGYDDTVTI